MVNEHYLEGFPSFHALHVIDFLALSFSNYKRGFMGQFNCPFLL